LYFVSVTHSCLFLWLSYDVLTFELFFIPFFICKKEPLSILPFSKV
jgi:hypothetical protein